MKARLTDAFPASGDWRVEIKLDGIRAVAVLAEGKTRLYSRNRLDLGGRFPEIVSALQDLALRAAVLDGEVVALDAKGRSSFQLLQQRGKSSAPLFYYLFDLLQLDGKDLKGAPLEARRGLLRELMEDVSEPLRFSADIRGESKLLIEQARKLGLEGLIVKRAGSTYEAGRRSGAWLKLKILNQQELVIGGYTEPKGGRKHFGALLVGYFRSGKLIYASKVGTGFDEETLRTLSVQLKKLETDKCPFQNLPETGPLGLSPAEMRRSRWVRPRLIAEIRFSEWTEDGHLRQPVFLGLRLDKKAKDVVREKTS